MVVVVAGCCCSNRYYGFISCRRLLTWQNLALVFSQFCIMKHHFLRRKRTLIVLICISFTLAIFMGIKLHIDLGKSLGKVEGQDGLSFGGALPVHFIKSSLDKYADGHPSPKTLQEFGHNLLIDKGKMMHKHVKNKIVEKLSDIGFLKIHENDGHLSEKKGEQKHANGIKHEMKKREISGKIAGHENSCQPVCKVWQLNATGFLRKIMCTSILNKIFYLLL